MSYVVRAMERTEVDFAVNLAAAEGWNPGLFDADCFYAQDPKGFLIGVLDGEPISCISVVRYGDSYGFLGFYVVKAGMRGKGYGIQIWREGMAYLEGRTVGLDGVVAQIPNYTQSGFELAHNNIRYRGEATDLPTPASDPRVVALDTITFDTLVAYDTSVFSVARPDFLACWISRPEGVALGFQEEGDLKGYTVLRKCREGTKIGPLFADTAAVADALFGAVLQAVPHGEPFFLDIPEKATNPEATHLVEKYGMEPVFETARMYRGRAIEVPLRKWFGVTTFELG